MERSGQKAGERAGKAASKSMKDEVDKGSRALSGSFEREFHKSIDEINKSLGGIDIKRLSNSMRSEVSAMKKELAGLKDVDISAETNFKKAYADIAVLEGRLLGVRDGAKIVFRSDIDDALKGFGKLAAAKERISDPVEIEVSADFKVAERQMTAFEKSFKKSVEKAASHLSGSVDKEVKKVKKDLDSLQSLRIGVDISSNMARRELAELQKRLKLLGIQSPDIDVKVDTARAYADLATFEAALKKIDGTEVKVDTSKASRNADQAANSFRSFNIILLATASAGPALVPILGAIAGGLLALGPAAAVGAFGLGSVLLGFSGLGDALSALQSQQDQAATNAQSNAGRQQNAAYAIRDAQDALADARRNAARAAEDAAERVADARRTAARAAEDAAERVSDARERSAEVIEEALERQRDAQENYRDAVQDVADAEQALREAREDARKDAESLAKRQRQNAVDERQAVLDLGEAQNEYNNVLADGSATNTDREQAAVSLEQAQIALNDTRDEQVALADEAADYAKNGVDGSEKVQSAQEELTDAIAAQAEAVEAVKQASIDADQARADGAEMISEAIGDQKEALTDAARAIKQALEDQNETHSDNARAIEDAQQALARARESATQDLGAIDSQAQAVKAAFDKLGPAGQKFALFLFSLKDGFYQFRDAVQQAMLPAVQQAIEGFIGSSNAGKAQSAIVALAGAFGEFVKALSQSFQGPAWAAFFEMLAEVGPKISEAYGAAFIAVMEGFASILTTTAPFALEFAEGVQKIAEAFAEWAASGKGQKDIMAFIGYVKEVGPAVLEFVGALAGTLAHALEALAPYGSFILELLTSLLDYISAIPIDTLGLILSVIVGLVTASQIAYAVMNILMAGAALIGSTVGAVVFAIVGIGLAIAYLYHTNEGFRDFIKDAWARISEAFTKAWEEHIKPALENLWVALQYLWDEVLAPFLAWLAPKVVWVAEKIIPLLGIYFGTVINLIAKFIVDILVPSVTRMAEIFRWLWFQVLKPVWGYVSAGATWLWKNVLKPAFEGISDLWDTALRAMDTTWSDVLQPVFDFITGTALPALQTAFQTTIDAIGRIWESLQGMAAVPVKFVIEKVMNEGLIAGFNKVASWVGQDGIDPIGLPSWAQNYATGGVLPGYTPGRDVHSFVSPTAGTLNLSGGEAIMRPEWTAAMGPDYVNRMNALARRGGVKAIQNAMAGVGGYFMGGILPLLGGSVVQHAAGQYPGYAADLNYPGYADYGKPVKAWKSGILAQRNYIGDDSYGRWAVLNHAAGQSSLYAHLSNFADALVGQAVKAGQTIGYVGDIGNTGTPPTSHLHFEVNGGSVGYADTDAKGGKGGGKSVPGWMLSIIKDPLGAVKNWITAPLKDATDAMKASPIYSSATKVPALLGEKVTDKVWDVIPGWAKTAAGWAGDAAKWTVGGVKNVAGAAADAAKGAAGAVKDAGQSVGDFLGFADGGILPYNGTMMYDSGGYLPPGLTTVMNLTGKPEPVFTADQFDGMGIGKGGDGFTYAPTIQGSDLTAADLVDDLDFNRRRVQREGKYGRSKP